MKTESMLIALLMKQKEKLRIHFCNFSFSKSYNTCYKHSNNHLFYKQLVFNSLMNIGNHLFENIYNSL